MTLRAITYARVSGDDRSKEGRNLAGQLEMCREYANSQGYTILAELAEDDRGASGASFELEQLGKVLQWATERAFDILVVREVDRLSRNLAKQLIVEEWLRREGVSIEYVLGKYPDTPEGNLMKHVRAVIAEYEREKIRERIERGKRLKVKSGSVMTNGTSRPPYGYKVIEVDHKWKLKIFEPEARIVRMIFDWYAFGDTDGKVVSLREIARRLTQMKVPTRLDTNPEQGGYKKRGYAEWSKGQLGNILASEVYKGIWTYGKRKTNGIGKGSDLIKVSVPEIVAQTTWQKVQERSKQNKIDAALHRKSTYLLSGRMKCGHCGASFNGEAHTMHNIRYYRCLAIHKGGLAKKCNMPSFRVEIVDRIVWDWVVQLLTNPESLQEGLNNRLVQNEKESSPLQERLKIAEEMLEDNKSQLARLIDLYMGGEFPKEVLIDRKNRLEEAIKALERERANIQAALERATLTPKQIENIYEFAKRIRKGLNSAQNDPSYKRQIIDALDVRVIFAIENHEKVVYTQCVLDNGPERIGVPSTITPSPCPTPLRSMDDDFLLPQ
ncbi:MAG: recombinase family protein [Anaerolineales bacterium]